MSPQPDEKRQTITGILDLLRPYAPGLGSYEKSIYTHDFDYSVKLSNGRIRLPEELIDDYERSSASLTIDRLKHTANRFVPNEPVVQVAPAPEPEPEPVHEEPVRSTSNRWRTVIIIAVLVILGILWFRSTQQNQAQAAARENIPTQVVVESSNYMVNRLLGGITDLRVTVTNNSDYLVDIVKVKVTYIKADGDTYKEEMLYFSQLDAHSTKTLDAPNSDRGTKVSISRESLTCSALQLN
jgi:archaellum component FlaF (FlaF/FlaG flagellin family)